MPDESLFHVLRNWQGDYPSSLIPTVEPGDLLRPGDAVAHVHGGAVPGFHLRTPIGGRVHATARERTDRDSDLYSTPAQEPCPVVEIEVDGAITVTREYLAQEVYGGFIRTVWQGTFLQYLGLPVLIGVFAYLLVAASFLSDELPSLARLVVGAFALLMAWAFLAILWISLRKFLTVRRAIADLRRLQGFRLPTE